LPGDAEKDDAEKEEDFRRALRQTAAFDSGSPRFYPSNMFRHTTAIAMACCRLAPACG
jgi:hypothetical protein